MQHWQTTRFNIDLSRPQIMGIVNVTPDSFSDGGQHDSTASALRHAEQLVAEGAHILDIGGESTRPGAPTVPPAQEWARIEGTLKGALTLGVPVSVDTCKTEVMQRALDAGADIVNDIRALLAPGALDVVRDHGRCGVCLMHMQGDPDTMQQAPAYADVMDEVRHFLLGRLAAVRQAGVADARITLDPGIGFGKTPEHNLALLRRQRELLDLGLPLLLGWSRKSTLGQLTGRPVDQRLVASVTAALAAVQHGARIVRVHDVGATADALRVWEAAGLLDDARNSVTI
ncbi:dihydropteroate synthase [Aquabacterium sp.]|jgi:dihydropteroate synthase|uniref:dihydropteroate synthase n=1 Tax=Aquabacterium sp. TaxID=1872578 RepID=UPI00248918BB|nr:dihydropteroate synthase [Aquabacterium sp.]MDI1348631.1 dihydropteroate synthase [Aquabacterium sp.]